MATVTTHLQVGMAAMNPGRIVFPMEVDINFATTGYSVSAADVVNLFTIPAGTEILTMVAQVHTAEGGACTVDIGDSGSTTRFFSNLDLNAAAYSTSATIGYVYASAGTVIMTMDHNTDAARVRVYALCAKVSAL